MGMGTMIEEDDEHSMGYLGETKAKKKKKKKKKIPAYVLYTPRHRDVSMEDMMAAIEASELQKRVSEMFKDEPGENGGSDGVLNASQRSPQGRAAALRNTPACSPGRMHGGAGVSL